MDTSYGTFVTTNKVILKSTIPNLNFVTKSLHIQNLNLKREAFIIAISIAFDLILLDW